LWAAQNNLPSIQSITAPNGTYSPGDQIPITITFDLPVSLAGGNLTIQLNDGSVVTITPFTNSTTATGTYTAGPVPHVSVLDSLSVSLAGGATLRDASGDDASPTLHPGASLQENSNVFFNRSQQEEGGGNNPNGQPLVRSIIATVPAATLTNARQ